MLTLLNKLFVKSFYTQNAGTFTVIILLAFGFMRASDHEAIIMAVLGSPFLLSVVFVLWGLYLLKTTSFVRQQLTTPEYRFVQSLWLVPTPTRWLLWLAVQISLLLPILAYAGWMLTIAVWLHLWLSFFAVLGMSLSLTIAGAWLNDHRLRHPNPDTIRLPHVGFNLPYPLFFPAYWLRQEPLSLVLTKVFSGLLLAGVCRLYPTDDYDQRLLLIGLLLAVLGHSQVGGQVSAFERQYLLFLFNLPLSKSQRFGRYALTYGLIWLPELLILLRNCPTAVSISYVVWLWLAGWGWLLLMHSLAYGYDILPERWLSGVFAGFIGGLLLIMFGLPVGAWLLIGWLTALSLWFRYRASTDPESS